MISQSHVLSFFSLRRGTAPSNDVSKDLKRSKSEAQVERIGDMHSSFDHTKPGKITSGCRSTHVHTSSPKESEAVTVMFWPISSKMIQNDISNQSVVNLPAQSALIDLLQQISFEARVRARSVCGGDT
eukprot:749363-Amphidinium_carterae.1